MLTSVACFELWVHFLGSSWNICCFEDCWLEVWTHLKEKEPLHDDPFHLFIVRLVKMFFLIFFFFFSLIYVCLFGFFPCSLVFLGILHFPLLKKEGWLVRGLRLLAEQFKSRFWKKGNVCMRYTRECTTSASLMISTH
jgi:hypothetical protein